MKWLPKVEALARLQDDRGHGCPMCTLAGSPAPIAASPHAVAILDRYAARPGHVLIVLARHEEKLAAVRWDEYEAMQRLAWRIGCAIEAALAPRRIYVAALGSAVPLATSFPHVHLHVIPLADGGEADRPANVFTWTHGMYVFESPDEERALADRLRAALPP
jgi:diadenosine tetraphosphate (Ap4A) HIT family hydrolase